MLKGKAYRSSHGSRKAKLQTLIWRTEESIKISIFHVSPRKHFVVVHIGNFSDLHIEEGIIK